MLDLRVISWHIAAVEVIPTVNAFPFYKARVVLACLLHLLLDVTWIWLFSCHVTTESRALLFIWHHFFRSINFPEERSVLDKCRIPLVSGCHQASRQKKFFLLWTYTVGGNAPLKAGVAADLRLGADLRHQTCCGEGFLSAHMKGLADTPPRLASNSSTIVTPINLTTLWLLGSGISPCWTPSIF